MNINAQRAERRTKHLHKIYFYKDRSGKRPVADYLEELADRKDKDSRIKLNKIRDYVKALSQYGTQLGEPYIKHVDGDIWELRPISNRILFAAWSNNSFILLHHFVKKTRKTPQREIDKAQRELEDFRERWDSFDGDYKRF